MVKLAASEEGDKWQGNCKMESVWKCPFCSSSVSDSRNRRRLNTSPSVDARVSELFQSVGCSRGECPPCNVVCKACFQKVEKLLKLEDSVSSILNTLKASIQTLALTATTQAPSAHRVKRGSSSPHFQPPSKRPALENSRLTPSAVVAKTTSSHAQPASRKVLFPESVKSAVPDTPDRQFLERLASQAEPSPVVKVCCIFCETERERVTYFSSIHVMYNLQVEVGSGSKATIRTVASKYKPVVTALVNGAANTFAKKALSLPKLRHAITEEVKRLVKKECKSLCTTLPEKRSILRDTRPAHLTTFSWQNIITKLSFRAPMLHAVLSATVERRSHDQTRIAPRVGMAVAILMRERNQFMCAAQTLVSIVLHASHAGKMVCYGFKHVWWFLRQEL